MSVSTKEIDFENEIEYTLLNSGYIKGDPKNFDRKHGFDTTLLFEFLQLSQPTEWEKLTKKYGSNVQENVLKRLEKDIDKRGILKVLRKGVTDAPAKFKLCYFPPASKMNKTLLDLYNKNIFSITRQVHYSEKNKNSIDIVLFINGIPFATLELKNQLTGQTVLNAINQYKNDRCPKETLLSFNKRSLVHFAVDTDEVWMTTELKKENTFFLPFNKGNNCGKGNPINPNSGCRTSYLWEEILQKDSILDIIHRFIHFDKAKNQIIFPRYHQLDVVRSLINDLKINGTGKNYLIQHSAGSGKSNSIAWLSHHLSNLHNSHDKVIFNSTIVITDRTVLDKQLQDTINQFEHETGLVQAVDKNSAQLAKALNDGKKIIITTLQKFPFILENVKDLSNKRFAIIVDEAHSSQSGESSRKMKSILGQTDEKSQQEQLQQIAQEEANEEEKTLDYEDVITQEMNSHGALGNLSFFAFTATPKPKTLEIFGTPNSNGLPEPFHLYSMKQAIEEGFILDVLENYITYETYFNIGKTISEDPRYEKSRGNRALNKFLSLHSYNIAQKTQIIIEHFRNVTCKKIGGKAKAMLVTQSRLHAVRYYFEFQKYIKKMNYEKELGVLVAFSGELIDGSEAYTEVGLNNIQEKELPSKFNSDNYQILLVAEKYQTGFDEPLLHTMFVDKKLSGVKAVQTLSRVNRTCKGKKDTLVIDFVNSSEEIKEAFEPYYTQTEIEETTDYNIVYDLKDNLDDFYIYTDKDIENFAKAFFKPTKKIGNFDFAKVNKYIDPIVEKYKLLDEEQQEIFKSTLQKFNRMYSFVSNIVKLDDMDMHKFFAFGKMLDKKLPKGKVSAQLFLDEEVKLQYYRNEKIFEGKIELEGGETLNNQVSSTNLKTKEERLPLSELVSELNSKFGTDFTESDMLIVEQIFNDMTNNEDLLAKATSNTCDRFTHPFDEIFWNIVVERMTSTDNFYKRVLDDEQFGNTIRDNLAKSVYKWFNGDGNTIRA